jgi:hypothetical protein
MRTIERKMIEAIKAKQSWRSSNTRVEAIEFNHAGDFESRLCVYLFDNLIAKIYNDRIEMCDCGWQSATTKSRLNAILWEFAKTGISQVKRIWYLTKPEGEIEVEHNEWYTVSLT